MRTVVVTALLLGACYRENAITPCTLTCNDAPCPSGLVCGSDFICQTPGGALCSTITGDTGGDGDGGDGGAQLKDIYVKAPDPDQADAFGSSIALSPDGVWLAVGAPGEASNASGIATTQSTDNSMPGAGAVFIFKWDGSTYAFQTYIKSSNPNADDSFGASIAFSADANTLVVGASHEDGAGSGVTGNPADNTKTDAGAVFVFKRASVSQPWSQAHYIKAPSSVSSGWYGTSVAISGDGNVIASGEPGQARAHYFRISATTGTYTPMANSEADDLIGYRMAMSRDGDTLFGTGITEDSSATGCGGDATNNTTSAAGAAYVHVISSAQHRYCKASNPGQADYFGTSIATDGTANVWAVGAAQEDSNATGNDGAQTNNSAADSGAVYIFTRVPQQLASWMQATYLKPPNTTAGYRFGSSVALAADGSFLIVGASGEIGGAVHTFEKTTQWEPRLLLTASNGEALDGLGESIGVSDDHGVIAAGAPGEDSTSNDPSDNSAAGAGAVYVFR